MRDRKSPRFGMPEEAKTAIKDTARLMRHGLRSVGAGLVDRQDGPSLSGSLGEVARAADRFLQRTGSGLKAAIAPGAISHGPAMQPPLLRAVLAGTASEHLRNVFVRQWRAWIMLALEQLGHREAIVLERPLRSALMSIDDAGTISDAAAMLYLGALAGGPMRQRTGLSTGARFEEVMRIALAATLIAALSAVGRKGDAAIEASPAIAAALQLVASEETWTGLDRSALAARFEKLALLL
jgi:hypothetical protein